MVYRVDTDRHYRHMVFCSWREPLPSGEAVTALVHMYGVGGGTREVWWLGEATLGWGADWPES